MNVSGAFSGSVRDEDFAGGDAASPAFAPEPARVDFCGAGDGAFDDPFFGALDAVFDAGSVEPAVRVASARAASFLALVDLRLTGPRTGVRGTKIHPTCSTGLPP